MHHKALEKKAGESLIRHMCEESVAQHDAGRHGFATQFDAELASLQDQCEAHIGWNAVAELAHGCVQTTPQRSRRRLADVSGKLSRVKPMWRLRSVGRAGPCIPPIDCLAYNSTPASLWQLLCRDSIPGAVHLCRQAHMSVAPTALTSYGRTR